MSAPRKPLPILDFEVKDALKDCFDPYSGQIERVAHRVGYSDASQLSRRLNSRASQPIKAELTDWLTLLQACKDEDPQLFSRCRAAESRLIARIAGEDAEQVTPEEAEREIEELAYAQMKGKTLEEQHELFSKLFGAVDRALRRATAMGNTKPQVFRPAETGNGKAA